MYYGIVVLLYMYDQSVSYINVWGYMVLFDYSGFFIVYFLGVGFLYFDDGCIELCNFCYYNFYCVCEYF